MATLMPTDPLVKKDEFPRLVAALVRARLQGEIDALKEENNA
jgi:hypothetical protein